MITDVDWCVRPIIYRRRKTYRDRSEQSPVIETAVVAPHGTAKANPFLSPRRDREPDVEGAAATPRAKE